MSKIKCVLSKVVLTMIAILTCLIVTENVYAGGNPIDDCGDNLYCDYSIYEESDTATLYINLKENLTPDNNEMYEYGAKATPWDRCGITGIVKEIDMGYGVSSIGSYAFEGMNKLNIVYIPQTVEKINSFAFKDCQNLKIVYYGGTQEEWDNLCATISKGNDFLLNANIICMDQGTLKVDLRNGEAKITRAQETILNNTLDYQVRLDFMAKEEEPVTRYNLDDNTNNYDIQFGYNISDFNDVRVFALDDSSMLGEYTRRCPLSIWDYRDYNYGIKTVYDYCVEDIADETEKMFDGSELKPIEKLRLPYHKCYYSAVQFIYNDQDKGEFTIDLRDKDFQTTTENYKKVDDAFYTFAYHYESFKHYKETLINTDGNINDMKIDIDKDGTFDINFTNDGASIKIEKLDGANKNMEISIADMDDFKEYMSFGCNRYYYSKVKFLFKDNVVKVDKVPATCDKDGTEQYWKSTDNSNIYADAEANQKIDAPKKIPATGHKWGEWKTVKEASFKAEGTEERVCFNDPKHKETRKIPKLKKGSVIRDSKGNAEYKIVSSGSKAPTVEYKGTTDADSTSVVVPDTFKYGGIKFKVVSIADNALQGNKKITSLVIGKNVKKIGKNAYNGCTSLKNIRIKTTKLKKKTVGKNAFKNIHPKAKARVPKKKFKAYKKILRARGMKGKKQKITK